MANLGQQASLENRPTFGAITRGIRRACGRARQLHSPLLDDELQPRVQVQLRSQRRAMSCVGRLCGSNGPAHERGTPNG